MEELKPKTSIKSWDQINDKLKFIAESEVKHHEATAKMNEMVQAAQNEFKDTLEGLNKDIDETRVDILNFAKLHEDDFAKEKTKVFDYGTISIREGTGSLELKEGVKDEKVIFNIKKIYKKLASTYIKTTEAINKHALKTLDEKALKKLGLFLRKTKTISISVDLKQTKAKAQAA